MQLRLFNNIDETLLEAALEMAYEAGRWHGQVDMEISLDLQQYSQCLPEVINSRRTAMPADMASTGRTVKYNLRSDEWRNGVVKSSRAYLTIAKTFFLNNHK